MSLNFLHCTKSTKFSEEHRNIYHKLEIKEKMYVEMKIFIHITLLLKILQTSKRTVKFVESKFRIDFLGFEN